MVMWLSACGEDWTIDVETGRGKKHSTPICGRQVAPGGLGAKSSFRDRTN
jgi:hypothetical protein